MRKLPFTVLTLVVAIACAIPAPAEDGGACPRIGVTTSGMVANIQADLTTTIFSKAGLCVQLVRVPQKRINAMEDLDELDGDAGRVRGYIDSKPSLIGVPTPIFSMSVALYWPAGQPEPTGGERKIGALLGAFWTRKLVEDLGAEIYEASTYDQLIHMMENGHLQEVLMAREVFENVIAAWHANPGDYRSRDVGKIPLYFALNRRFTGTVPALDRAIKALIADGTIPAMLNRKPD